MFEKALKLRLRFASAAGQLTTEDLFNLPLTSNTGKVNLDTIGRSIRKQLKDAEDESLVETAKSNNGTEILQLQFDIVKHIIDTKMAEQKSVMDSLAKKEQKDKLLNLIAEKQDAALSTKSVEELTAMVNAL